MLLKLALLAPVIFALGGTGKVAVEGATPVSLGKKKGTAYPVKCEAPIKFTATGPASLVVDVRGQTDALSKPVELDFTRNDKAVSKNAVTLTKSKNAGKGFAGVGQVVLAVPEGVQTYAIACDAPSDIAMSFRLAKKPPKGSSPVAEVAVEPKAELTAVEAEAAKHAEGAKPAPAEEAKPAPAAAAAPADGTYVGVFTPMSF
jgi:hypothetical protein